LMKNLFANESASDAAEITKELEDTMAEFG
jgi:hypothetical protein